MKKISVFLTFTAFLVALSCQKEAIQIAEPLATPADSTLVILSRTTIDSVSYGGTSKNARSTRGAFVNGFSFPFGADRIYGTSRSDNDGYYDAQPFNTSSTHLGSDWNIDSGGNNEQNDPMYAAAHGEVVYAANAGSCWGNVVIIRHNIPYNGQIETMYGHMASLSVKVGDWVSRRQQIGTIGGQGLTCDGKAMTAHVHVEARTPSCRYWGKPGIGYSTDKSGFISFNDLVYSYFSIPPILGAPATNASIRQNERTLFWWANWWLNNSESRVQVAYSMNGTPAFNRESGFQSGLVLNSNIGRYNGLYLTIPYSGTFYWSIRSADSEHTTWFSEPRKFVVNPY